MSITVSRGTRERHGSMWRRFAARRAAGFFPAVCPWTLTHSCTCLEKLRGKIKQAADLGFAPSWQRLTGLGNQKLNFNQF